MSSSKVSFKTAEVDFDKGKRSQIYLKKLRKLGLIDLKTEDGAKLCAAIQKMAQLSTLDVSSVSESNFLDLHNMENPPCNL